MIISYTAVSVFDELMQCNLSDRVSAAVMVEFILANKCFPRCLFSMPTEKNYK